MMILMILKLIKNSLYKAHEQDNERSLIVKFRQIWRRNEDNRPAIGIEMGVGSIKFQESWESRRKNQGFPTTLGSLVEWKDAKTEETTLEAEQKARDALFRDVNNRDKRQKKQEADDLDWSMKKELSAWTWKNRRKRRWIINQFEENNAGKWTK